MAGHSRRSVAVSWLLVMLVFGLQMVIYSRYQPQIRIGNGRGDDGVTYGAVADQFLLHQPVRGPAPFVYRLGTSWLAARYSQVFGTSVDEAFRQVNAILTALLLTVVFALGTRFSSPTAAAIASILYTLPFWSYTRCVWFYPVLNDLPWLLLMFGALSLTIWWPKDGASGRATVLFAALCFAAPLTRETGLLTPLVWIGSRAWFCRYVSLDALMGDSAAHPLPRPAVVRRELLLSLLFVCLTLAGLAVTRVVAFDTGEFHFGGEPYRFLPAAIESIKRNTIWHFGLSVCLAFGGPLIALLVLYGGELRRQLRRTPSLVVYVAGIVCLSLVGGVNTLRFLSWASPVVFMLLAHSAERYWDDLKPGLPRILGRALLVASVACYVLMIHPFEGYYDNYLAWMDWGGLQSSDFRSARYLIPCLSLLGLFVFAGRQLIGGEAENERRKRPPWPGSNS